MIAILKGEHEEARALREFRQNVDHATLRNALIAADSFAFNNIWHRDKDKRLKPLGGPFAAQLMIYHYNSRMLTPAVDLAANNVVNTGIGSDHAEAMLFRPDKIGKLREKLSHYVTQPVSAVLITNAECCPACRVKAMIAQRYLRGAKLAEKPMIVAFSATYGDTYKLAGFNDLPYAIDDVARSRDPKSKGLMVQVKSVDWHNVPPAVRKKFWEHVEQHPNKQVLPGFSVTHNTESKRTGRGLLATGTDKRLPIDRHPWSKFPRNDWGDIFATSEVEAIRAKCRFDREKGVITSWETPARLFTLTQDIGPLCMAEAKWASIYEIISIRNAPKRVQRIASTLECPGLTNKSFFGLATRGYNRECTGLSVARVPVANTAQPDWPKVLQELGSPEMHYDGLIGGFGRYPALDRHKLVYTRRFTAPTL